MKHKNKQVRIGDYKHITILHHCWCIIIIEGSYSLTDQENNSKELSEIAQNSDELKDKIEASKQAN